MYKTYLNSVQVELAKSWLPTGCEPYGYNSSKGMLWYRQLHYSGTTVNNGRQLSPEQIHQLDSLRSCQCGSGVEVMSCHGHPLEGATYCG